MSDEHHRPMKKPTVSLLVTDLDNTLWDWVDIWFNSFNAMLQVVVERTGLDQMALEQEIRSVHQARGTSEYTYLLNELPLLREAFPGKDVAAELDDAVHAYRSARKAHSRLYDTVRETLEAIRSSGTTVVAYTESLAYVSAQRLRCLGLDGIVQYLYSPADHDFPPGVAPDQLRSGPDSDYVLQTTEARHTPPKLLKPSPEVLQQIVDELGTSPSETVYIGDSIMKDVMMGQRVGVHDVHAEYGVAQQRQEYELLRRVSHWSEEDVQREREIASAPPATPTYTLQSHFAEILDLFSFTSAE
jgi:phosphoglycolate phosphatase-like HAD superfamily hydrolase